MPLEKGLNFLSKIEREVSFRSFIQSLFRRKGAKGDCADMNELDKIQYVLIYGGCCSLGSKCVHLFKSSNWWVGSVDYSANTHADVNIMVGEGDDQVAQEHDVLAALGSILQDKKLHVIICFSSSWLLNEKLNDPNTSGVTSICATIAARYLVDGGLFVLSGSNAKLHLSTKLVGYGRAKSAVSNLIKLLDERKGEKSRAHIIAVLPTVLDASTTTGSSDSNVNLLMTNTHNIQFLSDTLLRWANGKNCPPAGSLCQIILNHAKTEILII